VLTPYGLTEPPVARERQRGNHAGAVQNRRVPRWGDASAQKGSMRMSMIGWPIADLAALDNIGPM
jgi:hypothetical protein